MKFKAFAHEFFIFGLKEARSCVFAGSFFGILFLSSHVTTLGMQRYDFILFAALVIQLALVLFKLETPSEVATLLMFHAIGLALEIFKTNPSIGSWSYPEPAFFKIFTVPLYSGFMYSAVASYICQAWRVFNLRVENYPSYWASIPLCAAIYINFFTHHWLGDFRWWLTAAVFIIFYKTKVWYTVTEKERRMPLTLSFVLIGFFIWVAENISTLLGAWKYPNQANAWHLVHFGKISSWFMLVIISFIIVADLKFVKDGREQQRLENRKSTPTAA